jgi:chorismate dehydratase
MLKLGHIAYSNCVPVHGRFLEQGPPPEVTLVHGVPAQLNRRLARGEIDIAPASSIEYARHADAYRILPSLSISARGPVQTILLLTGKPIDDLADGSRLALPTASATSVALLKIMLRQRFGIQPEYVWFEQELQDPFAAGMDAALYIGDIAYRQRHRTDRHAYDLAALWVEWTGLPFVFALWQTGIEPQGNGELRGLVGALIESRDWSQQRLPQLAARYADEYRWSRDELVSYWKSLTYDWSEELASGLEEFYRRAAELGEIAGAPAPRFLEV